MIGAYSKGGMQMIDIASYFKAQQLKWVQLLLGRILFKFAGQILQMTTSYILIVFTHRAHAWERACASKRVIECSLIYGRIIFKFAFNRLHITTNSMGYVLFMLTHHVHACERARGSAFAYLCLWFSSNFLGTYYKSPHVEWATYFSWRVCVIACPNSTHQYAVTNSDTYDR
jgi:hypothetical protein